MAWPQLVGQIHAAACPAVIAVTGGGVSAISSLLAVPGGSRSVLEATVPYSPAALTAWLGRRPDQFCSETTALAMAVVAWQRAVRLLQADADARAMVDQLPARPLVVGAACTASLVSAVPKRGAHRCYVATHTALATAGYALEFEKGARGRPGEEALTGQLLLSAIARAAGLTEIPSLDLRAGEAVTCETQTAAPLLVELTQGQRGVIWAVPRDHLQAECEARPRGLVCGAFNPLHAGHRKLRDVAARLLGGDVGYEISVENVDKPPLDYLTIARRRSQFESGVLALTNAPTFAAKARVLPGTVFVVGVDTAERIVAPRYYSGSVAAMDAALDELRAAGCRFLVAGRLCGNRFLTLADVAMPGQHADLFEEVPEAEFRVDLSSTELRNSAAAED